ncbi:putative NAD(P)-binding-domain-containing protein [Leucosporidium creatinivorum]|uniref:precorrin-2 dehydrogenase n=1 Tax=Leucosporidium creatinivorum TaxID=106004 RepID=A0A1Y2DDR6_9BASI|nr:putative NAD(P)-binding-domain-containing protein [Leucosporidium creatinivorum]
MSTKTEEFPAIQPGASLIIAWQIKNKRALVVGGGAVAAGRLSALLNANALVTLVAPSSNLSPEVASRIADVSLTTPSSEGATPSLTYIDRVFAGESDLEGMEMVLTAIDEIGLSSRICEMCRTRRIPVNVADVPPECDFYFGSIVRRGPLQIMVSTGGKGPRIANRVRRAIEGTLPDRVGDAIESVGTLRSELRKVANGKDKATIERRMDWMVRVCDKWSLAELAEMDERMRQEVLDGWEDNVAKGYWDVNAGVLGKAASALGLGKCPARDSPDGKASRCPFVLTSSGFLLGLTAGVVATAAVMRRWN